MIVMPVDLERAKYYRNASSIVKFRIVAKVGGHQMTHECLTYEQAVQVYNDLEPFIGEYITVMEAFNVMTYKWETV